MRRGGIDQSLVNELLRRRVLAATLANQDLLGTRRERDRVRMHQRIIEDNVGPLQQSRRAQRKKVGRARTGADEIDSAVHATIPAATVLLVASSMTIKLPVARLLT